MVKKLWRGLQKRIARTIIQYALDQLVISPQVVDEIQKRTRLPHAVVRIIVEIVFDAIVRGLNESLERYDAEE